MIRHILLIRFKPDASSASILEVKNAFLSIPSKISGLDSVEWGVNDSPEQKNKGYTHCVFMTFTDNKTRESYLVHPAHLDLKTIFRPTLEDIIVFDYTTL